MGRRCRTRFGRPPNCRSWHSSQRRQGCQVPSLWSEALLLGLLLLRLLLFLRRYRLGPAAPLWLLMGGLGWWSVRLLLWWLVGWWVLVWFRVPARRRLRGRRVRGQWRAVARYAISFSGRSLVLLPLCSGDNGDSDSCHESDDDGQKADGDGRCRFAHKWSPPWAGHNGLCGRVMVVVVLPFVWWLLSDRGMKPAGVVPGFDPVPD